MSGAGLADSLLARARAVRAVVFDVDGVLTDGGLYYGDDGREYKRFHVHDGLGIKRLRQAGLRVGFLSARACPAVGHRARDLAIDALITGSPDKAADLEGLAAQWGLACAEIAYVGDDWPDLPAMARAGLAIAVANATDEVLRRADHVTARRGGDGAAREVADLLLAAQGHAEPALARVLRC